MTESYLLSIILFAPFVGAVVLLFVSNRRPFLVRQVAVLIDRFTGRTLPSPRAICMPPVWGVWEMALVQSARAGAS